MLKPHRIACIPQILIINKILIKGTISETSRISRHESSVTNNIGQLRLLDRNRPMRIYFAITLWCQQLLPLTPKPKYQNSVMTERMTSPFLSWT